LARASCWHLSAAQAASSVSPPAALFLADGRYVWIALVCLFGLSIFAAFRLTLPHLVVYTLGIGLIVP
jgi:hypothetical protein